MSVAVIHTEPRTVVVSGEIDLFNAKDLRDALEEVTSTPSAGIVLDMSNLTYIDSAGIAAVLAAYQRIRRMDGKMALVLSNRHIKEIFSLIHIDELPGVTIHADPDNARRAITEPPH